MKSYLPHRVPLYAGTTLATSELEGEADEEDMADGILDEFEGSDYPVKYQKGIGEACYPLEGRGYVLYRRHMIPPNGFVFRYGLYLVSRTLYN